MGSILKTMLKAGFPARRFRYLMGDSANISTHMKLEEKLALYEVASRYIGEGKMLEVGSYLGASSVILAEVISKKSSAGRLYCVDTWQNDAMTEGKRPTLEQFESNTSRWSSSIEKVMGNSREVEIPDQGPFDLVFIDGDHSYEGAKSDAARFSGLVRTNGVLVFHDANRAEVARVVGEVLAEGTWIPVRHAASLVAIQRV
jgi:predicted O-methyltransferase YrrM